MGHDREKPHRELQLGSLLCLWLFLNQRQRIRYRCRCDLQTVSETLNGLHHKPLSLKRAMPSTQSVVEVAD